MLIKQNKHIITGSEYVLIQTDNKEPNICDLNNWVNIRNVYYPTVVDKTVAELLEIPPTNWRGARKVLAVGQLEPMDVLPYKDNFGNYNFKTTQAWKLYTNRKQDAKRYKSHIKQITNMMHNMTTEN